MLRRRSREKKVQSSIPRFRISVEVINTKVYIFLMLCAPLDWQYAELPSSASDADLCTVLLRGGSSNQINKIIKKDVRVKNIRVEI